MARTIQRTINACQKTRPTTVTLDSDYTVKPYDKYIVLSSTAATTKTLTLPTMNSVQVINIRMNARVAGEYVATVTGGTLTFNAASESAQIISNPITGLGWQVISLNGATVV